MDKNILTKEEFIKSCEIIILKILGISVDITNVLNKEIKEFNCEIKDRTKYKLSLEGHKFKVYITQSLMQKKVYEVQTEVDLGYVLKKKSYVDENLEIYTSTIEVIDEMKNLKIEIDYSFNSNFYRRKITIKNNADEEQRLLIEGIYNGKIKKYQALHGSFEEHNFGIDYSEIKHKVDFYDCKRIDLKWHIKPAQREILEQINSYVKL